MKKKSTNRTVRTHMDASGIIIYRLLQGEKKQRAVHTFGFGTCHKIWLRVLGLDSHTVTMTAEPAAVVKEQIARWGK